MTELGCLCCDRRPLPSPIPRGRRTVCRSAIVELQNEVEKYGRTADCSLPFVVVDASRINFSRLHLTTITTLGKLNLSQVEAEAEQSVDR